MKVAWDPLILAAVAGGFAAALYVFGHLPRVAGFLTGAALLFGSVGFGLLALAHHPLKSGMALLIVIPGFFVSLIAFVFIVIKGHHKKPLFTMRKRSGAGGPGGPAGAGKGSAKAPHHRAMVAWVAVTVFTFLFVANLHEVAQVGRGGWSQTVSGITQ